MKSNVCLIAAAALCATATVLTSDASARTIGGHAAKAVHEDGVVNPAEEACLRRHFDGIINTCRTPITVQIPLVVDNGGAKWVAVTAFGSTEDNNVGCAAVASDDIMRNQYTSGWVYLPAFGTPRTFILRGAYVPGGGSLYVQCALNQGGELYTITWNP